jgi:AcrR family transcriptional regulator
MQDDVQSTREKIIVAGERLFAERGLDGVALREVSSAAGNANNSAVHYHFGSKDRLVQAIFEYRLRRLSARWELLMAESRPRDLYGWVDCYIRALLEESELGSGHSVSFVAMLMQNRRVDLLEHLPEPYAGTVSRFVARVQELLVDVAEPLRVHRIEQGLKLTVYAAADREHARATGARLRPLAFDLASIVDGMVGYLTAPVSARTLEALADMAADPT